MEALRPEAQIFGRRLRELRVQRGLSQAALAEAVGTSGGRLTSNYVSDLERGLKAPTLTMILKLSRALDVSASELLSDFSPERVRKLRLE
jgi:transcriptional regulator with XRE-family HTH domain